MLVYTVEMSLTECHLQFTKFTRLGGDHDAQGFTHGINGLIRCEHTVVMQ